MRTNNPGQPAEVKEQVQDQMHHNEKMNERTLYEVPMSTLVATASMGVQANSHDTNLSGRVFFGTLQYFTHCTLLQYGTPQMQKKKRMKRTRTASLYEVMNQGESFTSFP